jgi:hypothetical protein
MLTTCSRIARTAARTAEAQKHEPTVRAKKGRTKKAVSGTQSLSDEQDGVSSEAAAVMEDVVVPGLMLTTEGTASITSVFRRGGVYSGFAKRKQS